MKRSLVICFGNIARGDDGAAHRVAELVRPGLPDDAELVTAVQLDVTMAEEAAASGVVVFVDAERRDGPPVRVEQVAASLVTTDNPHFLEPGPLLGLTGSLYGEVPVTWLVSVAAHDLDHGEGLSPQTARAAELAAAEVLRILATASPAGG